VEDQLLPLLLNKGLLLRITLRHRQNHLKIVLAQFRLLQPTILKSQNPLRMELPQLKIHLRFKLLLPTIPKSQSPLKMEQHLQIQFKFHLLTLLRSQSLLRTLLAQHPQMVLFKHPLRITHKNLSLLRIKLHQFKLLPLIQLRNLSLLRIKLSPHLLLLLITLSQSLPRMDLPQCKHQ